MTRQGRKIIIVGGGFAGVRCARELRRLQPTADIALFACENHMVFQPLLADVAGSSLNPRAIAAPLRQLLRGVRCRNEEVLAIDPECHRIRVRKYTGDSEYLPYDYLVLAVGNKVNLSMIPGMLSCALPLKTVGDAIAMRAKVMEKLEQADTCADADEKRWLLSFVVVGGGFSGVEVAGEINDLARHSLKYFPGIEDRDISVHLVHSGEQVLPEVSEPLRLFAQKRMQKAGVNLVLNERVNRVNRNGVNTRSGRSIQGGTVICTIGNTPTELVKSLDAPKEKGRLVTEPDMRVKTVDNIWAIGDCAWIPNAYDQSISPATAQFAERQGRQAARNISRQIDGEPTRPFSYHPVGSACGIGGRRGVAELYGFKFSGFLAWWLWRSAFLIKLPSLLQKLKVGFDWAWEVLFPRDISYFSGLRTQPVGKGFYSAGETVLQGGKPQPSVFAIEKGECEIVYNGRVISVLGSDEIFSSATLQSYGDGEVLLRARTDVDLIVIADDLLTRVSRVLKPLQNLLRQAEVSHEDFWDQLPGALKLLERQTAASLMQAPPSVQVKSADTVVEVFEALREQDQRMALVLDEDGKTLRGLVTRTDLMNGLNSGADARVGDCMRKNPIAVAATDRLSVAAGSMRDAAVKSVPVLADSRKVVGLLKADDIIAHVIELQRQTPTINEEENA